jgi:circadian clock protein KaiC
MPDVRDAHESDEHGKGGRKIFARARTGIAGLDYVLDGGLPVNRLYLVQGDPGAGKTTLAMQFLLEGVRRGEPAVYATLSETEDELRDIASSHGWDLTGLTICDLQRTQTTLDNESQYTLFHPSEVELSETTRALLEMVDQVKPTRLVVDSLSEMRLLARDSLRYRRQILSFKQYFTGRNCTLMLLDYATEGTGDCQLQSLTHGLIHLEHLTPAYGGQRRRLRIQKVRGVAFREGYHDFAIRHGGVVVYPRLVAADHRSDGRLATVSSGLPALDTLLGGGVDRGTSTMLLGPSGVGKTTLAAQYMFAAAQRGERSVAYLFDELSSVWAQRAKGLGMDIDPFLEDGTIRLRRVDPAEVSPGEFAHWVGQETEAGTRLVVIDSLNGYQNAMLEDRFLGLHLRELLSYLNEHGVMTLMVMTQHGLVGSIVESPIELSYLADNVILLRYFEAFGEVRQAISAVKKRTGGHERSIREFRLDTGGLRVGKTLANFQGVLSGNLTYLGELAPLMTSGADAIGTDG